MGTGSLDITMTKGTADPFNMVAVLEMETISSHWQVQ